MTLTILKTGQFRKNGSINKRQNPAGKLFTLIELLVVVAIIGILASMILPSLKKARTTAHKAVCSNNLKTLGTGMELFLIEGKPDNDPDKHIGKGYYPSYQGWPGEINLLLGANNNQLTGNYWLCPSPQRPTAPQPLVKEKISYGANLYLTYHNYGSYKGAQAQVERPSEVVLFAPSKDIRNNNWIGNGADWQVKAWHGTTAPVAFVDGHVASHSPVLLKDHTITPLIRFDQYTGP
ncbi:MAG: type II secretion system protein [Lentisphaeraceae bacterium]|nr:type II secretion system protein [Lentisphaeraceae bacterium]